MCFKFKSSEKLIHILLRKNLLKRGEKGVKSREKLIHILLRKYLLKRGEEGVSISENMTFPCRPEEYYQNIFNYSYIAQLSFR